MDALKRNNVQVIGEGTQPLLLAHGFGCDQTMWRFLAPAFETEYKIILFDHVGFGLADSSGYSSEKYSSLQAYADDILEICEALSLQDVVFVGHSVSAIIGLLAAIQVPELFEKLIMISPSPCYINKEGYTGGFSEEDIEGLLEVLEKNYIDGAHSLARLIVPDPEQSKLRQELEDSICHSDQQIALDFARLTFRSDNRADLIKAKHETLILQSSEDLIASPEVGYYMHEHMPASTLSVLKATGHCPHLSDPEETVAAIKNWLRATLHK